MCPWGSTLGGTSATCWNIFAENDFDGYIVKNPVLFTRGQHVIVYKQSFSLKVCYVRKSDIEKTRNFHIIPHLISTWPTNMNITLVPRQVLAGAYCVNLILWQFLCKGEKKLIKLYRISASFYSQWKLSTVLVIVRFAMTEITKKSLLTV